MSTVLALSAVTALGVIVLVLVALDGSPERGHPGFADLPPAPTSTTYLTVTPVRTGRHRARVGWHDLEPDGVPHYLSTLAAYEAWQAAGCPMPSEVTV